MNSDVLLIPGHTNPQCRFRARPRQCKLQEPCAKPVGLLKGEQNEAYESWREIGMDSKWDKESSDCAAMVADRNLSEDFLESASGPLIVNALEQLTHVKLYRENITSIDMIRYILSLPNMTNLYLQQNGLKSLRGIELAKGLKFLIVSNNQLTDLHGLSSLSQLMVLDASDNTIYIIDAAELPQSLSFLNVDGNPCCTSQEGLREHLKTALPNLKELDGDGLTDYSCSEYSTESEGEEEKEVDDERIEGTCSEGDHGGELDERAGVHLVSRTSTDIGKDLTPCGRACRGSSREVTFSAEGCSKLRRTGTLASRKELTQPPVPDILERLGTPSPVAKALGSTPLPHPDEALENVLDADIVEYHQLKDSLYGNNLDAEGSVQTVLSNTVGGLDYPCNMMIERAHERIKHLDVQLGQEIIQMFFSPETSPRSTATSMDQFQEASSSGNLSSSVMSPRSVDHWKDFASTSSECSNSKESPSVRITGTAAYKENLGSEQEEKNEV